MMIKRPALFHFHGLTFRVTVIEKSGTGFYWIRLANGKDLRVHESEIRFLDNDGQSE